MPQSKAYYIVIYIRTTIDMFKNTIMELTVTSFSNSSIQIKVTFSFQYTNKMNCSLPLLLMSSNTIKRQYDVFYKTIFSRHT